MLSVREKRLTLKTGRVGVISDTHGLVRPEAIQALKGSELILHAGDIGKPEVLTSLAGVAPVIAIRGNNDRGAWAKKLPDILRLRVNGFAVYIIHNVNELEVDPAAEGFRAVISGHSHKPSAEIRRGVLFLNPGSAGPRRFNLPVAVARIEVQGSGLSHKLVELAV